MSIPGRIFQTWKSKTDIPPLFGAWRSTFLSKNPTFEFDFWDDQDNRTFITDQFPWFLKIYDRYTREICRVDCVRYFYLYLYGGVYADMDTECLRPLDQMLHLSDVLLGRMGSNASFPHSIPNAIMASAKLQKFWLLVIQLVIECADEAWPPEYLTGPVVLRRAVELYLREGIAKIESLIDPVLKQLRPDQQPVASRSELTILDSQSWYALDWSKPEHQSMMQEVLRGQLLRADLKAALCGDAWMVTYWAHSWE